MASLIASVLALVVAGWAAYQTFRHGREQNSISHKVESHSSKMNRLTQRLVDVEEDRRAEEVDRAGRARLVARMETRGRDPRAGRGRTTFLTIENEGAVAASEIRVLFEGVPFNEHGAGWKKMQLPNQIARGAQWETALHTHLQQGRPTNIRLEWRDEAGEQHWESDFPR